MLPSRPSGSRPRRRRGCGSRRRETACPMPVPPCSGCCPGGQPGAGDEAELRGAVVLEDGRVGRPAAGGFQGPRVQLRAGADDAPDARGVHPAAQAPFTEQPQHRGDQDQPGDAVMADGGVGVADVEPLQGVELRAGIQAFGQRIEVQAGGERPGRQRPVVRGQAEELDRRLEGLLPGPARAGEGLGHGRGAGGQSDQERRVRRPVGEVRPGGRPRAAGTDGPRIRP